MLSGIVWFRLRVVITLVFHDSKVELVSPHAHWFTIKFCFWNKVEVSFKSSGYS